MLRGGQAAWGAMYPPGPHPECEKVLAATIAARPPPAPPRPVGRPWLERPALSSIKDKLVVWVQLLPLRLLQMLPLQMLQHLRNFWTQRQSQILAGVEAGAPVVAGKWALALRGMQLVKEHQAQGGAGEGAGTGGGRGLGKGWRS